MKNRLLLLAMLPLLLGSCALLRDDHPEAIGNVERETITRHLELATEELAAGKLIPVLERLIPIRELLGVPPEDRNRAESLMTRAVDRLVDPDDPQALDAEGLYDLYRMDLSPRLRALAGVTTAERRLEEGRRISAYKMIRKVEDALPNHSERASAGDVLARAGLSLAADGRRYYLIRKYEARGLAALEFLVVVYPLDPHCAEAYSELVRLYEKNDDLDEAIERTEDLLWYHPQSPYSAEAEARLPHLRLRRLRRDSYDRKELEDARREAEEWIARYPGHELEGWVTGVRDDAVRRLASSDLILARYYDKIDSPFGVRLHAQRALEEANAAGATREAAEAQALLETLPPPDEDLEAAPAGANGDG